MNAYLFVSKIRVQTALAYRFNVISTILVQCLIMYAMSCFWTAAYDGAETVSGVSQRDMITYTTISVIMGNLLTMGVQDRIARSVRSGSVALDLLKPMNIYGIYLAEDLGDCAAALLQKAVPLLLVGTVMFGFPAPASVVHFLFFLLSFAVGYLINWLLAALLGLCAFKTLKLGPLANVKGFIMKLLSGSIFPLWFSLLGFGTCWSCCPLCTSTSSPCASTSDSTLWRRLLSVQDFSCSGARYYGCCLTFCKKRWLRRF